MAPRKLGKPRKGKSVTISVDLHEWVEEQVKKEKYAGFSHVVEAALIMLRDSEKEVQSKHEKECYS